MNFSIVRFILGWVLEFEGIFLLLPAFVGVFYKEWRSSLSFFATAALCLICGFFLKRKRPKQTDLYTREGFASVALSWTAMSVFGALPFLFTGEIPHFIDALFETVSGFTTTGASILSDVEALSHASLFWRSFTHWIGGMGVFVFIMAILPLMGGGTSMNLMRAESPGPSVGKLVPRVKDTAKILYEIYIALTLIGAVVFCVCGLNLFDSLTTIFGTVGTGGFGTYNDSVVRFSPLQQNMITLFMILSGINYSAYFCLLRRQFKDAFSIEEVRVYLLIILGSVAVIVWNIHGMYPTLSESVRHAFFQVGSIITTTGFSSTDFNTWPQLSKTILVLLMFVGACAGSTGGGIKISRILLLIKSIRRELSTMIHPRMVKKISMDGHVVPHDTMRSLNVFIAVYFILFFSSVLVVGIDNFDFTTNFTAVLATLNNIGPGLEMVGPTQNFSIFSPFSKCVLIFDMLAGRLELLPMLILLNPSCWKKY
ncbi:MAG: TrkH family potassium uptake protein [Candidatus Gastranaerophilales bacterium]|nr:TrkH family potassium uptake protein [Candidatus Gastranaerophilales bacterium]